MMKVSIDVDELTETFGDEVERVLDEALNGIATFAEDRLRQISSSRLGIEAQQAYASALKTTREKDAITIELDESQRYVEEGRTAFDMKPGLLRSPKAKQGRSGPYMDVPFSHRMTQRGKGTFVAPRTMREAVQRSQRALAAQNRASGSASFARLFPHKRGDRALEVHGDMKVGANSAQTWRRVSENSPPDSWQHPGTKGVHAFDEVISEVERFKDQYIEDLLKAP